MFHTFSLNRLNNDTSDLTSTELTTSEVGFHGLQIVQRQVSKVKEGRTERLTVLGLAGTAQSSKSLSMESSNCRDEVGATSGHHGNLQASLNGLGSRIGKEGIFKVTWGNASQQVSTISSQWVQKFLRMQSLLLKLGFDGSDHFGVTMASVVDTKSSQTINILFTGDRDEDAGAWRTVSPFDGGEVISNTLTILQKSCTHKKLNSTISHQD